MKENADLLLRLPGTADEKNWLREHLETLSVRERDILAAALERSPPAAMADAVNHLLTLDKYEVCPAGSYEALDELRVRSIQECTLLDARCILPCVQNLAGQYHDPADLIYDGQQLGVILDERGQGSPGYLDRFFAALEFENCRRLNDAVNTAENLREYEVVRVDAFADHIAQELSGQAWAKEGDAVKGCFDYASYAAALAKQQGYCLTGDGQYYIRSRDSPALEQQQTGVTM